MGRPKITLKEYIISCHLKHNFFYDYTQTDLIKTNFCNINNINLIRINYKQNHRTILENLIGDIKNAI
ncbi:hypothetical protein A4_78 [Escherichia phage A4]|nr:hypothetical protein A4_78 [Escherichia phage A4]